MDITRDFASLATAHLHFYRWQRARHRARNYALISFPDNHPLRQAVDALCSDLDSVDNEMQGCAATITGRHGGIRGIVNGFWFESEETLFKQDAQRYHDCPQYQFGRGIRRRKVLPLGGVASIHDLENTGQSLLVAARTLAEAAAQPGGGAQKRLDCTRKVFARDCRQVLRQLKRVEVDSQQKSDVLLCLQRAGLPRENAALVLAFVV